MLDYVWPDLHVLSSTYSKQAYTVHILGIGFDPEVIGNLKMTIIGIKKIYG